MNSPEKLDLSLSQKDIYFDQLHHAGSPMYNIGGYVNCGYLDIERIKIAHRDVVLFHDAFGVRIVQKSNGVSQYIDEQRNTELPFIDFSKTKDPKNEATLWLDELFQTPMKYHETQLCQAYLLKIFDDNYWYVGLSHHLVMDGWGFLNWAKTLADYYNEGSEGKSEVSNWKDITLSDHQYITSTRYQKDKVFWQEQFKCKPQSILPANYVAQFKESSEIPSSRHRFAIKRSIFERLSSVADSYDVGVPQLFLGILASYFSISYGNHQITFGIPAHNRKNYAQKKQVGVFTSVSPLSIFVDKEQQFSSLLTQINNAQKSSYRHQRMPIGQLMHALGMTGEHQSFYDISFNYLKLDYSDLEFAGTPAEVVYHTHNRDKIPLTVTVWDGDGENIELQLDHNHAYFSEKDIERLGKRFLHILNFVSAADEASVFCVKDLPLLPPEEINELVLQSNDTDAEFRNDELIHELISEQALMSPDSASLVFHERTLTYQELDELSNQLGHYLREQGVGVGMLIGVCMSKSAEMVVGMLAIMKAGAAYVPIDPSYPKSRMDYMIDDAGLHHLLCFSKDCDLFREHKITTIEIDWELLSALLDGYPQSSLERLPDQNASNLAYLIYTSGSTGKPKAVCCLHRSVINLITDFQLKVKIGKGDNASIWTNINFDVSVYEIFSALCSGATLYIMPEEIRLDEIALFKWLEAYEIHSAYLPAFYLRSLYTKVKNKSISLKLKRLLVGVEPIVESLLVDLQREVKGLQIINGYGPSEATVCCSLHCIDSESGVNTFAPIGRPIINTHLFILSKDKGLCPIGVVGELYIGGVGLAREYLKKPELNAERFITNPFTDSADNRLYRTGDLVRYLDDGRTIQFVGRADDQIKINGNRIEPGEISAQISSCHGVDSCVVLAVENLVNAKSLVAYVVPEHDSIEAIGHDDLIVRIKRKIESQLPRHMIPSAFILLEEWPTTLNGKIDKSALPVPDSSKRQSDYIAPQSASEQKLTEIWADILNLNACDIGVCSNFFNLGGNSLLVMRLVAEIHTKMKCSVTAEQIFSAPYIRQTAEIIKNNSGHQSAMILKKIDDRSDGLMLSFSQQSLWFIDQLENGSAQYNISAAFNVYGSFDVGIAEQAIRTILQRHLPLRTIFKATRSGVVQKLKQADLFLIRQLDFSELDPDLREKHVQEYIVEDSQESFDLSADYMLRASYVHFNHCDQHQGLLILNMHHIASDGWSVRIFINEFCALYSAYLNGEASPLAQLDFDYVDYVYWQRNFLKGDVLDQQLDYWIKQLANLPLVHNLPLDFKRPAQQSYRGKTHKMILDKNNYEALVGFCQSQNTTTFMGIYAVFSILLARYSNETDIIIGSPVANREQAEVASLIGLFVNNIVLRSNMSGNLSFKEYLHKCKTTLLEAYAHQHVPFEQIVEELQPLRSLAHSPLFQVMLSFQQDDKVNFELLGAEVSLIEQEACVAKYDLTLTVIEQAKDVILEWEFASDIFRSETIAQMANHFESLLESLVRNADRSIFTINMLSEEELHQQISLFNKPLLVDNLSMNLHGLFEAQVNIHPDAIAIEHCGERLTYKELNAKANQLACYLLENNKVKPKGLVGICADRSLDMITSILAVLKAGCAYVPLDPNYPNARLEYMLRDAGLKTVLLQSHLLENTPVSPDEVIVIDNEKLSLKINNFSTENLSNRINHEPQDLAYVIYTSGTSGQPKGVMVSHSAIASHILAVIKEFEFSPADRVLQMNSFSFDTFIEQTFSAFSVGATVYLLGNEIPVAKQFFEIIQRLGITIADLPQAYLSQLLTDSNPTDWSKSDLTRLVVGGEALSANLVSNWISKVDRTQCQLFNAYGPTEAVITSTVRRVNEDDQSHVRIGQVLGNRNLFVLDEYLNLLPLGCIGELYISGLCIASGYLNQEVLTQEKFIQNPFSKNLEQRLYKTGDLVRWLPDGQLEFLGRKDNQVKIRGFRIELGEIESCLESVSAVDDAIVLAHSTDIGNVQLVAYLTSNIVQNGNSEENESSQSILVESLRKLCREQLPEFMLPSMFVLLDAIPQTPNGKVDRKALPELGKILASGEFVAPGTVTERALLACWSELLGLNSSEISINANFFELGGNSLISSKLIHVCDTYHQISISVRDIFEYPTIQSLAMKAEENANSQDKKSILIPLSHRLLDGDMPLSFTQSRIWFVEEFEGQTNKHNITGGVNVRGHLNLDVVKEAVRLLVTHHPILRTQIIAGEDGQPRQRVLHDRLPNIEVKNLLDLNIEDRGKTCFDSLNEFGTRCFNLYEDSLLSMLIVQVEHDSWKVFINIHHIISDGWSISLFFNEFIHIYDSLVKSQKPYAAPGAFSYFDYIVWQRDFLETPLAAAQQEFWKTYLSGCNQELRLPFEPPSTPNEEKGEIQIKHAVGAATRNALLALARKHKASLFNIIHSVLVSVLSRLTGERDLTIGVPVSGRSLAGVEHIQGAFINNLPVRSQIDLGMSFENALNKETANVASVLSNQELPFEKILSTVDLNRHGQTTPLFQILLNVLNVPDLNLESEFLEVQLASSPQIKSKFDLTLYVDDSKDGLSFNSNFNTNKYSDEDICLLLNQVVVFLEQVATDSSKSCYSYSLIANKFQNQALNNTTHDFEQQISAFSLITEQLPDPTANCESMEDEWVGPIHKLFEDAAATYPEKLALHYNNEGWSYTQLQQLSHAFAFYMHGQGIGNNSIVAIVAERSNTLVMAILAVLKTGAAFVLLDNDAPTEKLTQQLKAISPHCLIKLRTGNLNPSLDSYNALRHNPVFNVSELMAEIVNCSGAKEYRSAVVKPESLAYLSFTSGTEGEPKIILGRHSSLSHYLPWYYERFDINDDCRFAMLSGLTHDPLQRDIFTPLCCGGSLFIPEDIADTEKLQQWLNDNSVSMLNLTPSLAMFLWGGSDARLPSLRVVFSGGEPLTLLQFKNIRLVNETVKVINLYGSTETCRALGFFEVHPDYFSQTPSKTLPVGKGVASSQLLVLNSERQPCAVSELGEIAIRSRHLSLGYLNNSKETQRKFISNPFSSATNDAEDLIYLTGDLGRYLPDGNVVCLGRKDRQVKIRGFRVELAEVEVQLCQHDLIESAVVIQKKRDENDEFLIAFVTLNENFKREFERKEVQAFLKNRLASYMIPRSITVIDAMPLTANGKLDRKTLEAMAQEENAVERTLIPPQTDIEIKLLAIWQEVLKRSDICIKDDFFDIGGHSLLSTQILSRIKSLFSVTINVKDFFGESSIQLVASRVEQAQIAGRVLNKAEKKTKLSL